MRLNRFTWNSINRLVMLILIRYHSISLFQLLSAVHLEDERCAKSLRVSGQNLRNSIVRQDHSLIGLGARLWCLTELCDYLSTLKHKVFSLFQLVFSVDLEINEFPERDAFEVKLIAIGWKFPAQKIIVGFIELREGPPWTSIKITLIDFWPNCKSVDFENLSL